MKLCCQEGVVFIYNIKTIVHSNIHMSCIQSLYDSRSNIKKVLHRKTQLQGAKDDVQLTTIIANVVP